MRYTVGELARLSGVSTRTLRLYDDMGLLTPARDGENGYRLYGEKQVDALQQILFYRELGVELKQIKVMMRSPDYDAAAALLRHRQALLKRRDDLDALLHTLQSTLEALKGGKTMKDVEKFEGFKRETIAENERKYGKEARAAYGNEAVDASQRKLSGMTEKQWNQTNELRQQINEALRAALAQGDPAGEEAQRACELHKQWLCQYWPDGMYTKEAHRALGENYAADERFAQYYEDACGKGAAQFLQKALEVFTA